MTYFNDVSIAVLQSQLLQELPLHTTREREREREREIRNGSHGTDVTYSGLACLLLGGVHFVMSHWSHLWRHRSDGTTNRSTNQKIQLLSG